MLRTGGTWVNKPLRVAYLSADYHNHATAYLMAELIELHDRTRFETVAVSYGPDDGSDILKRLKAAFGRFLDVRARSDQDIAAMLAVAPIVPNPRLLGQFMVTSYDAATAILNDAATFANGALGGGMGAGMFPASTMLNSDPCSTR